MTLHLRSDWKRAFGEPVATCKIRQRNADFQVVEQLGFALAGSGEHDYLRIEKDGANTAWVARDLARHACVGISDVGFAGLKDRHAVTTQWFSVRRPAGNKADWSMLELERVRVVQVGRHRRKLRRGAHIANHFRIALRNLTETQGLRERLIKLRDAGVPNYFGEQRFGRDGANLSLARDLFAGRRLPRAARSLALSAARSFLFNRILEDRVAEGTWNTLLPGDLASLDGSNSIFSVAKIDDELRHRSAALDIHPSGALWGIGGEASERELSVVSAYPELAQGLENEAVQMARRALRLAVRDLTWERAGETMWLEFSLTRGGYATAVLREIAAYSS
ncbi:MAG: tRNA pseudouridine(13) synthase TruD [Woeseiaceae bacterium]